MTIAVVGLGAAGLRAAMLLEAAGVEVKLFEARDRLGGRLYTIRRNDQPLYEAGGEWIDADHARVLNLAAELGLDVERSSYWPGHVRHKGKQSTEDLLWTDALEDDLRVEAAARETCRNLSNPPWRNTHHAELERKTLADFLKENCRSERGLWWVTAKYRSDEGDDPSEIGLMGWLCGYLHYVDRDADAMSAYRLTDGAQVLCERMAQSLKAEPQLSTVLGRVEHSKKGVTLQLDKKQVEADRVILTLPAPALERVVFDPALSVRKRCAIEACHMSRAIKICWEFSSRWWLKEGWNGRMIYDGPLQQTWDGSLGENPILCAYICGDQAASMAKESYPVEAALELLAELYPQARDEYVSGWIHDWNRDPYAKGAFSHLSPGYVLEHMEFIGQPEGRTHFAGEHTAMYTGFIEGALESAERVVQEVLNA